MRLEEVPVPSVGEGQVLVRVERSLVSAGTERQAIGFAYSRHRDDADSELQIMYEAPDDNQLLCVLLPKVGQVGPHDGKQLGNDCGDAHEVTRPPLSLQHPGYRPRINPC